MRNSLAFNVGPWVYRVVIVADLADERGCLLMGRCVPDALQIQISADIQPQARLHVLLHELRHAWQAHVPKPKDAEEEADLSATISAATFRDLKAAGGISALIALQPEGSRRLPPLADDDLPNAETGLRYVPAELVDATVGVAPARAGRAQCGKCELIVADGSVATGPARWDVEAKGMVVCRTLYCPHCHHLQSWDEGATPGGFPNGAVVRGPFWAVSRTLVESFLEKHPEAAGLVVG